jgi:ubiquinone/menaquinone biosynthesis C-methylase UbiE
MTSDDDTEKEETRLRTVYRAYDAAARVSRKWARDNPGNRFLEERQEAALHALFEEAGLVPMAGKRVLDVGCGSGEFLQKICELGAAPADCYGVDLLPDRIERARRESSGITFELCDARHLPFEAGSFDLVCANMVFGSILSPEIAGEIAAQMRRVLSPVGSILWHEHRYPNPWNSEVRHYTRRDLRRLFPGFRIRARSVAPLPPVVRRLGGSTSRVAPLLDSLPALRVDYLAVLRRS